MREVLGDDAALLSPRGPAAGGQQRLGRRRRAHGVRAAAGRRRPAPHVRVAGRLPPGAAGLRGPRRPLRRRRLLASPGVPGVQHFAHAGEVAWAITNAMADYQDLDDVGPDHDGPTVLPGVGFRGPSTELGDVGLRGAAAAAARPHGRRRRRGVRALGRAGQQRRDRRRARHRPLPLGRPGAGARRRRGSGPAGAPTGTASTSAPRARSSPPTTGADRRAPRSATEFAPPHRGRPDHRAARRPHRPDLPTTSPRSTTTPLLGGRDACRHLAAGPLRRLGRPHARRLGRGGGLRGLALGARAAASPPTPCLRPAARARARPGRRAVVRRRPSRSGLALPGAGRGRHAVRHRPGRRAAARGRRRAARPRRRRPGARRTSSTRSTPSTSRPTARRRRCRPCP